MTKVRDIQALDQFQAAIKIDPDYPLVYQSLGNLQLQALGDAKAARETFRKLTTLTPKDAQAYFLLGTALHRDGPVSEKVAAYRQALKLNPRYSQARVNLGEALEGQGKFEDAIACYRAGIAIDPGDALAHRRLGKCLFSRQPTAPPSPLIPLIRSPTARWDSFTRCIVTA
jgi:tetratricopeptide (TPR) repeat protein